MKHNLLTALISCALSLASCSGCSDSGNDDEPNGGNEANTNANFALADNVSAYNFKAEGGSQSLTFTVSQASLEMSAQPSADWLTASKGDASVGEQKWTITASANTTSSERTATVTFSANDVDKTIDVTFTQARVLTVDEAMPSDAKTLVSKIYAGINIGNTMECNSSDDEKAETAWGNPLVNENYIKGLKALGFNAIRIPCAWHSHLSDTENYIISPKWLERVKTVVDYCVNNDMYVVLNSHWDTGWLEDNIFSSGKRKLILAEQTAIWTQIANTFINYDEHLIFSGSNEPGMNETSSGGKKWEGSDGESAIKRLISYEQAFIDAVRATGGNNAKRCLVFQGLGTDIASTYSYMTTLPSDNVENRLIAEVHFYEPYQWALMEDDASWGKVFYYWGKDNHKDGSSHNPTWGEESHVDSQFAKMKEKFVDAGIPVIIGEYSTRIQTHGTDDSEIFDTELHKKSRAYYNKYVTMVAKNNGCATFYWETGGEINRTTGEAKNQYAIDGIMEGASAGKYPF